MDFANTLSIVKLRCRIGDPQRTSRLRNNRSEMGHVGHIFYR